MKITPLDLRKQVFRKAVRGYDPIEVRTFLELVSEEFEHLLKETALLSERVRGLEGTVEDYRRMEKALGEALVTAQRTLEETRENARREGELLLEKARAGGNALVEEARQRALGLQQEITGLDRMRRTHLAQWRGMLEEQLRLLDEQEHAAAAEGGSDR